MALTVAEAIKILSRFPQHATLRAYEGEVSGIVVELGTNQIGWVIVTGDTWRCHVDNDDGKSSEVEDQNPGLLPWQWFHPDSWGPLTRLQCMPTFPKAINILDLKLQSGVWIEAKATAEDGTVYWARVDLRDYESPHAAYADASKRAQEIASQR